jgi:signal transduction histidine kinase
MEPGGSRLAGTRLRPPELEAEFRAATLREDGRAAAATAAAFTLFSLPFIRNEWLWAAPAGRLGETVGLHAAFLLTSVATVVIGLRARRPGVLDAAVVGNLLVGSLAMFLIQGTRPDDFYLPIVSNVVAVVLAWTVFPNRFALQLLGAAALTASAMGWTVLFRRPLSVEGMRLVVFGLLVANVAGGFASWKLHRSRRLQFLAIREERSLHGRLLVASRLAALGTLVAGVGHELNNPLTSITAGLGTAAEDVRGLLAALHRGEAPTRETLLARERELLEVLDDASEGAARIARIVKDLSVMGSSGRARNRVHLADVVESALGWLPESVRDVTTVRVDDQGAPDAVASRGQLEQVVLNLVSNAARAARPGTRGDVTIRLRAGSPGMTCIEVADRGTGMEPSVQARIFDPFFTTRPAGAGRGAGLGLSICHAIVAAHGGTIEVESEVGKGSTFRVELPLAATGAA